METGDLQTQTFRIDGMTCVNCQNRIEKKLKGTAGVRDALVSYEAGTATVTYNASEITLNGIKAAVESLGYKAAEPGSPEGKKDRLTQIAGTLILVIALYILFRMFSTSSIAAAFPVAQVGMGYGMVLIIGLLTSVHCIAMCGGINLSQTLKKGIRDQGLGIGESRFDSVTPATLDPQSPVPSPQSPIFPQSLLLPAILYNAGRLISYTAVGFVVGALGSVITVSGWFQGAILLLAGIFMLVMGLNMMGLLPSLRRFMPRMPAKLYNSLASIFTKKSDSPVPSPRSPIPTSPLVVGFLNGFMPCGPLQAMQLYALSTGSPVRGGVSMFLFCLGTIPLMFALGAVSGVLSGAKGQVFSRRVMYAGSVLVAAMGLVMFTNGWNLAGLESPLNRVAAIVRPSSVNTGTGAFATAAQNSVQIINSTLLPRQYPAITVQQGIPVRWIINAPQGSINGCNNRFIIREYGIEHTFKPGENVIEFLPEKTGRFPYSCWMGMIRSSITVVAEGESVTDVAEPSIDPVPAGVAIPTDEITLAQIAGNYQTVEIRLTDNGFEPAIVVMQRRLPSLWNINIVSPDPDNSQLVFPAFFTVLDMKQGDNRIQVMPTGDFEFSTGDNAFYGYVKVVDNINFVNIEAVKAEVAGYKTLVYPAAYFGAAGGGGCACCGG